MRRALWTFLLYFFIILIKLDYDTPLKRQQNKSDTAYENYIIDNKGWKCSKCGRMNADYTGTYGCGLTKDENLEELDKKEKEIIEIKNRKA